MSSELASPGSRALESARRGRLPRALSPAASLLGALSFAFAGAMTAQIPHFGLVAGMSWVPAGLLALLRLSQRTGLRAAAPWARGNARVRR